MKNTLVMKLVMQHLKPLAFSLFFTAAMTSLVWLTMTYGSLNAVPIAAGICAVLYSVIAIAALVNLFKGNKLFSGASADVLSVSTQKSICVIGVTAALPALIYCGIFAYLVRSYDYSEAAAATVSSFEQVELSVFGSSKIWDAINSAHSSPVSNFTPVPEATEKEIDFGPYMADLQVRIKKAWFPPKCSSSNHAIVDFTASKDGKVSNVRIFQKTGNDIADKAAIAAVENASMGPLPEGAPESVSIRFTFDYNVFSSDGNPLDTEGNPILGDTFSSSSDTFSSSSSDSID